MAPQQTTLSIVKKTYTNTKHSFKNTPAIFLPFLIFAIVELIVLALLYLGPRMPLRIILGPPIRTLWGEQFLHYPFNFILLPKLASLSRMVLSVLLSSLLTGMAVAIVFNLYHKKHLKLGASFRAALKKYVSLFMVVFILTAIFYFAVKIITIGLTKYFIAGHVRLLFFGPRMWLGPLLICINFIIGILIQSAFVYAIPVLIIEDEKPVKSIIKSFILFKKLFLSTIILVGLPMLVYIPIIVLDNNTSFLMNRLFPEFILLVCFLSTVISSLVIDPLVTVSTTYLYLINRDKGQSP